MPPQECKGSMIGPETGFNLETEFEFRVEGCFNP